MVLSASAQHPGIGGYNVYYGSLHNHSNVSDGSGTPATAYNYARNTAHLDFFGLSDHSTYLTTAQWTDVRNQADASNQDGIFTTFYGFEWSSKAGYGHITVFTALQPHRHYPYRTCSSGFRPGRQGWPTSIIQAMKIQLELNLTTFLPLPQIS
jgi:hypothetical protein